MKKTAVILLTVLIAVAHAGKRKDTTLSEEVIGCIASKKCPPTSVAVAVSKLEDDSLVLAINADTLLNPASVTKLVTGAVAFELLGQNHFFVTRIFTDSVLVHDSCLTVRNLYIRGSGDPGFTVERLWLFVENLHHIGIRKIMGDLVIDDFFFDSLTVGPGLNEDTTSRAYQPLVSALCANFSAVAIHHRPGHAVKQPVVVDLFPEIKGIMLTNTAVTVSPKKRKSGLDISTRPESLTTQVVVEGSLPLDDQGGYTYRKLWQTWQSFGGALRPLLARRGIALQGTVVHAPVPKNIALKPPLHEFVSQPLSMSIDEMFKYSSNFVAEMLFKTLSARRDSVPGSWKRSAKLVADWWKKQKLPGKPVIINGSGMGDTNRLSTRQIVALLRHVWLQKNYAPEYISALSVSGVDGTVKSRFEKSPLRGLVRAKTGTLNSYGISTLAGYLMLESASYAFAVFCSGTGQPQSKDWLLQEKILEKIAEHLAKR
ncbi:MAG: D-alanyl-D-alanine carboxypeptidase/D-alanyl-D-alanine-endopeptidase [Chitinispirillaceae bacterium]|nr:D-alanyl-D-alanine carboxypeptidase/D-alanyl-D-alanine-endopeptidase [Chitinispirillaceae bacterium]